MKQICLFSLLVLIMVACNYQSVAAPTAQPLPGRAQVDTATPHLVTTAILGVYSDASVRIITETVTPWPTWTPTATTTPIPSNTPTMTPSATPTATATNTPLPPVTATFTPSPTPPPVDTATPTQEITPVPTITTAPPAQCEFRSTRNINKRSGPGTGYGITGLWPQGEYSTFGRFVEDSTYLWAQHTTGGWSVIAQRSPFGWWVSSTDLSDGCVEVEGWPGYALPEAIARAILQGAHILDTEAAKALLPYCSNMTTVKFFEHAMQYAAAFRVCNPDLWIVCRYWSDNIARETDYDAELAYQRIGRAFPNDCDAIEGENEKAPDNDRDWARWSRFSIDFATLMATRRDMQYLAFSFGPGWPALDKIQYIVEYVRWVDTHPLPDGRYHGIASHAAMYAPWSRGDMPWVNSEWLAGMPHRIRDVIYVITADDYDLYHWRGVWAITEVGLSDGYSGNWDATYTCQEVTQAYWATHDRYVLDHFPHAQHHWNFGGAGWTDDTHCAPVIWAGQRTIARVREG